METNRRNFLIQGGATVGVIGLGYLLWDSSSQPPVPGDANRSPILKPPTGLLAEAVARMKAEGKPGVVVRIPVEAEKRHQAGHCLLYPLFEPDEKTYQLFAQSVFICVESAVVQEKIHGADPSHAFILIDCSLRAVAGIRFDYDQPVWDAFVPAVTELVQGKEEIRLRARAESIRRSAPAPVIDALERLDSEGDRRTVAAHLEKIAPLVVYESLQPTNEIRKMAISDLLREYIDRASATVPGPKLPFGVETTTRGGCGDSCHEQSETMREIGVMCGMGRVRPEARFFLRYLSS